MRLYQDFNTNLSFGFVHRIFKFFRRIFGFSPWQGGRFAPEKPKTQVIPNPENNFMFNRAKTPKIEDRKWHCINFGLRQKSQNLIEKPLLIQRETNPKIRYFKPDPNRDMNLDATVKFRELSQKGPTNF